MNPRVVVTGLGIVSPLGVGTKFVWSNLLNGACGITKVKGPGFDSIPCKVAGYIPLGSEPGHLDVDKKFNKSEIRNLSLSTRYALLASEEALDDANWKPQTEPEKEATGVAVGVGMLDLDEILTSGETLKVKGYSKLSPFFVPKILANMAAGNIGIRYGFQGPNHTVSTACTTGVHAIGDAFNFIRRGDSNVMVCGGAEGVIGPLSIAAFARMRALATAFNEEPSKSSRPFDENRNGFVMGEGAGILILESLDHALSRGTKIYAEILGYGLSSDGSHITAPRSDGKGAFRCMENALKDAAIKPNDVGYINAHATSTPIGDEAEIRAIKRLFPDHSKHLRVSSTKGATGHVLGAAGAVEALFTIMAVYSGKLPPNINLEKPLAEAQELDLVTETNLDWKAAKRSDEKRIAVTNSFGFGGTNASLVIGQFR